MMLQTREKEEEERQKLDAKNKDIKQEQGSEVDPDDIEFDIDQKEGEDDEEECVEDNMETNEKMIYKDEHLSELNEDGRRRVYALQSLQKLRNNILLKYKEELEAIERKYDNLLQPNYRERDEIAYKELPYFWYYAMLNNEIVTDATGLSEADKPVFKFLKRVFCSPFPREVCQVPGTEGSNSNEFICKLGFDVVFEFDGGNPFFEESVLVKSYYLVEDDPSTDPIFDSSESTPITWKEDYKDTYTTFGFFVNFFRSSQLPLETSTPEEVEELTEAIQRDFEAGRELRDKVCPNAYLWYTGDAEDNFVENLSTEDLKGEDNNDINKDTESQTKEEREEVKEPEDTQENKENQ